MDARTRHARWSDDDRAAAIAQICHGAVSYKDIKEANVWRVLRDWLSPAQRADLDPTAPSASPSPTANPPRSPTNRQGSPWIASASPIFRRLGNPAIANGRVPLLVHILTPGQKPWQMTKDLKSFWAQMKKEIAGRLRPDEKGPIAGRYPRHPWPDNPKTFPTAHSPWP
jgi:ATP-dependent helicase HrpB